MEKPEFKRPKTTLSLQDDSRPLTRRCSSNASDASCNPDGGKHYDIPKAKDRYPAPKATRMQLRKKRSAGQASSSGLTNHNASMFKLQIEDMLQKDQQSYKKQMSRVDLMLRTLKKVIEDLPDRGPIMASEAEEGLLREYDVQIPFPEPRPGKNVKYAVSYARPTNVNIAGSFARKTALQIHSQQTIDLAVTMPSKIFQQSDYLNYRYFYKRAYFLAQIAAGIRTSENARFRIEYATQNDNHLQPIILVTPDQEDGRSNSPPSSYQVRILLAADENLFPVEKLRLDKSCLCSPSAPQESQPTPFYNASIRSECCSLSYLKFLHRASCQSDGFQPACVLGSIWLRKRGFGGGLTCGGFGPFEWACTVALLMQEWEGNEKPRLSRAYSSYEIFKATLEYLSQKDLVKKPAFIGRETIGIRGNKVPILFDGKQGLNLLFKMTSWSYFLLRHEAITTLKMLNDPYADHFGNSFLTQVDDPLRRFDYLASFDAHCYSGSMERLLTHDAYDYVTQVCFFAHRTLERGIGDRAHLVTLQKTAESPWPITATRSHLTQSSRVLIGLLLNSQQVHRIVDRGPSIAETEAAASFRAFWGEKAELRRFKDGSIEETVIWPQSADLLEQLLKQILRRHLSVETADSLSIAANTFKHMLSAQEIADPVASYKPMMNAYAILEKQIRTLKGIPLHVRQISIADEHQQHASLSSSWQNFHQSQTHGPANVFVQFEGSSRWPDDLAAVQWTKVAFLQKIGELLEASAPTSTVSTRLGLEGQTGSLSNVTFLDVGYSSGAFFRLRIHHDRELMLLERALGTMVSDSDRDSAARALSTYKRKFVQSPLHAQAVRNLNTRFPPLWRSICLMKIWRDSQLLSHHIGDELIELLTIHSFVQSHPWTVPGSETTGFLRALTFISNWDWRFVPLIIDFTGEMNSDTYDAIHTRFEAWRNVDPAMNRIVMFVASNHDPEGITWTESGPSKIMAARLTSLAKAACCTMERQGTSVQAAMLFKASLVDYDFVLLLDQSFVSSSMRKPQREIESHNLHVRDQQYQHAQTLKTMNSFVDELRTLYGSNIIFCHNQNGGSVVGGLWNPQTGLKTWKKVNVGYSTTPVKETDEFTGQMMLNKAGTLHDIAKLGGNLILKIVERK